MQPYEIVVAPLTVYVAPVGTAFPAIDAAPTSTWFKLGQAGSKNYEQAGVTVTHNSTDATFVPAGGTAPRKAFRTDEGLMIGLSLVDLTPDQYAKILDDAAVVTTAQATGIAGNKAIEMLRGLAVRAFALLARGVSSVDDSLAAQFEIPSCYQSGNPAPVFSKGAPAALALEFTALERTAGTLGTLRTQTTIAG